MKNKKIFWFIILTLVYLVVLFNSTKSQQRPYGDIDCNGRISVSDIVYYINYMFNGGPAPQPCDTLYVPYVIISSKSTIFPRIEIIYDSTIINGKKLVSTIDLDTLWTNVTFDCSNLNRLLYSVDLYKRKLEYINSAGQNHIYDSYFLIKIEDLTGIDSCLVTIERQ